MSQRFSLFWLPAVAVIGGVLLSLSPLLAKVDVWLGDATHRLVSRHEQFDGALVVDIDEQTLAALKPHFGSWPYSRDVYGLVVDWLADAGAKAVVLDILLADPRENDDVLARALQRSGNGVLIASAHDDVRHGMASDTLRLHSWKSPDFMPTMAWGGITTPAAVFSAVPPSRVGVAVAAVREDSDGVLRRLPILHRVAGLVLPAPTVAAMRAASPADELIFNQRTGVAGFGRMNWPVDAVGAVRIAFPANPDSIAIIPFRQVAEAALGLVRIDDARSVLQGRTVFIGSSAALTDRVKTPIGTINGTTMLALGHQSLVAGRVIAPRVAWRDAVLALPVVVVLAMLASGVPSRRSWQYMLPLLAIGATGMAHLALLRNGIDTNLLMALTILAVGLLLVVGFRLRQLGTTVRHLEIKAGTDTLTGLLVRRAFLEKFSVEIERAQRQNTPLSIAILDLDHFKRINDNYGHPAGDLVLREFAATLRDMLRATDIPGRWGGEEFVVLMPGTAIDDAVNVLDRIRIAVGAKKYAGDLAELQVTMSSGVVAFDGLTAEPEALIGLADKALYRAKESGRNQICVEIV